MKNPFVLSNDQLLKECANACARAGSANSGFVMDFTGPYATQYAQYLMSIVLSRLDRKEPPFQPGDTVVMDEEEPIYPIDMNRGGTTNQSPSTVMGRGTSYTISEVHYRPSQDSSEWWLRFKCLGENHNAFWLYRANSFSRVSVPEPAAAKS